MGFDASRLGVPEGIASTVEMDLARCLLVAGNSDNWNGGAVFGDETGGVSRGGEDEDTLRTLLSGGGDSSDGNRLGSHSGTDLNGSQVVEERGIADGGLGEQTSLSHHEDRLDRICALGGFAGQHDTVCTIENGIGNIADLGTGGAGVEL